MTARPSIFSRPPGIAWSGIFSLMLFWLFKDLPFFWDTIQLGARQATHFHEGGGWLLPDAIDSGHPPAFGAYLAAWWSVLGRSLWVSHLAMLPWVWLLLHQLFLFAHDLVRKRWWMLALVPILDPVLLGQLILVSPDVVLIAAFVWGVRHARLGNKGNQWAIFLAATILSLVSTRGWIAGLALYFLCWAPSLVRHHFTATKSGSFRGAIFSFFTRFGLGVASSAMRLFVVAGLLGLAYLYFHYRAKGWIGYHPDSPWAGSFQAVGWRGMLKNFGLIGWRWLDVGRIVLWVLLAVTVYFQGWDRLRKNFTWWFLLAAALFFQLLLLPLILSHQGLTGPRYLLPAMLFFDLWVAYSIVLQPAAPDKRGGGLKLWQKTSFALAVTALLLGNLLIYPHRIAQAWDATPAHYPFYAQEAGAIAFLDDHEISLDSVGTVFPSVGPRDWRELNGRQSGFKAADLSSDDYLFVSIIHNDWTDEDLDFIEAKYTAIWQQHSQTGVWSAVMKRR